MTRRFFRLLCLGATMTMVSLAIAAESPRLDAKTYEKWKAFLTPSTTELAADEIPWRPAFGAAMAEARELGKPLLLWAMNGHPLGCT